MKNFVSLIILGLLLLGCGPAEKKTDVSHSTYEADYSVYASVLEKYVQNETVDYAALKSDRADLDNFVEQLAELTLQEYDSMDNTEQLALWINAYNALVLRTVIDAYPVASIKDIEGAMHNARWEVIGKNMTLDNIRDDILRHKFEDSRVLLALFCASNDGPVQLSEPYKGATIDDQLDSAAYLLVNNVDRNAINPHDNVIATCEIFSWYGDDFENGFGTVDFSHLEQNDRAVLNFIFTFVDDSVTEFIDEEAEWLIEYRPFDWSLNDVKR